MESEEMETFRFFRLRFRRAYDFAYDSDIWFSLGHKLPYDYDYDSDSVASENQPLKYIEMPLYIARTVHGLISMVFQKPVFLEFS